MGISRCVLLLSAALSCAASRGADSRFETTCGDVVEGTVRLPKRPSGNPHDVALTATFRLGEKTQRTTPLFYAGGSRWAWRFYAGEPGAWQFQVKPGELGLAGHAAGTITVKPREGAPVRGFVAAKGSKWVWSNSGKAFIPQLVMYKSPEYFHNKPEIVDADIRTFLVEHGFAGFHVQVYCRWFDIDKPRSNQITGKDPDPDPRTFEALEMLIRKVYAAGGMVHIWAWGDDARRMNPKHLGGLNGPADRRLQRTIAARLGPLPGWTMGYGFDLHEWVREKDLKTWHATLHAHFGWPHLLGARASKNRLNQLYEGLDYSSYEQHRPDLAKYCETIDRRPAKPSFSEDRFRIRPSGPYRGKNYSMERTRRGLWHSAMAGGVANIWGDLSGRRPSEEGSRPYARPYWIKTNALFFRDRFHVDMVRDAKLSDGPCLRRPTQRHFLMYKENATAIRLDLSKMDGPQPAVAVDALKRYGEIDLGELKPASQAWQAPYASDWAIAVGRFKAE